MLGSFRRYTRLAVIVLCFSYCCCRTEEESKITSDSFSYNVIRGILVQIKESLKNIELKQSEFFTNISQEITVIKNTINSENGKEAIASPDANICVKSDQEISYANCEEALKDERPNGIYTICDPVFKIPAFKVFCLRDHNPKEKPWTLIQRRESNSSHFIDFKRSWEEYKKGFGDVEYDHWLGLEKIFALSNAGYHDMWISYKSERSTGEGYPDAFNIGNETELFRWKAIRPDIQCSEFPCPFKPFHTFDKGNKEFVNENGGGGYWRALNGRLEINYNGQGYKDGKPYILIKGDKNVYYVHLALRENMDHIRKLWKMWEEMKEK